MQRPILPFPGCQSSQVLSDLITKARRRNQAPNDVSALSRALDEKADYARDTLVAPIRVVGQFDPNPDREFDPAQSSLASSCSASSVSRHATAGVKSGRRGNDGAPLTVGAVDAADRAAAAATMSSAG